MIGDSPKIVVCNSFFPCTLFVRSLDQADVSDDPERGTESPVLEVKDPLAGDTPTLVKSGEIIILGSDGPERGAKSPILEEKKPSLDDKPELIKYGELVILGYNGSLPEGNNGRRRSKFVLYKRPTPNGVKRSKHYMVQTPHSSQAVLDATQHSISFKLSRNQTVIVEYTDDEDTDMFQIGRSSESPIDFVVMDTIPGDKRDKNKFVLSTVSRFACRIIVERSSPTIARIYAAGFDSSRNIFLGEKAHWQENRVIDGVTTNGVLVMPCRGEFYGGDAKCGPWRETTVGGDIFSLRASRSAQQKGELMEDETNVLQDGTLIDLCEINWKCLA